MIIRLKGEAGPVAINPWKVSIIGTVLAEGKLVGKPTPVLGQAGLFVPTQQVTIQQGPEEILEEFTRLLPVLYFLKCAVPGTPGGLWISPEHILAVSTPMDVGKPRIGEAAVLTPIGWVNVVGSPTTIMDRIDRTVLGYPQES